MHRRSRKWFCRAELTQDSLVVDQVEVNHGDGRPHAQQGEHDEPGEEAAAAWARLRLLPILIGRLGFGGVWKETQGGITATDHLKNRELWFTAPVNSLDTKTIVCSADRP